MVSESNSKPSSEPAAKPAPPTKGSPIRYNPHSEGDDAMQVAAANWEILRRVPAFRAVAKRWIKNKNFRFQHVLERKVYKYNKQARCALDWMLTPEQRYELANYQIQHWLFFWDPSANYGPIIVKQGFERQANRLRECIDYFFDVKPDPAPGGAASLDQTWPTTPQKFRAQFSSIYFKADWKEIELVKPGEELIQIGNYLLSKQPFTSERCTALGRYLLQRGDLLRRTGINYKIVAIRRHEFYSERLIDEILRRIKESMPYDPRTGHDLDSKRSFLGTLNQWEKFLAWEAHDRNAYHAAAEFLPKLPQKVVEVKLPSGKTSKTPRSIIQRDIGGTIRRAVTAIREWFPKVYPAQNLEPSSVHKPK